jgi:serine protease Do
MRVGDWVVAVGNPFGFGLTVTAGIVSGKGRVLGHDVYDDFLQIDAAINEGNSGGPLFDLDGDVIGINTAIIQGANTIGFAIPIDMVKSVIDDLQSRGHVVRGYIGVRPRALEGELAKAFGTTQGVLVEQVYEGSPAAQAGLQHGDVIQSIDDEPMDDPVELVRTIGSHDPGEELVLRVLREGESRDIEVRLAERPEENAPTTGVPKATQSDRQTGTGPLSQLGIGVRGLSPQIALEMGVRGGVLVESVANDALAKGYLRPGDVIVEVNHWPVASPSDVERLLEKTHNSALFLIERNDAQQFVAIPLP